MYEEIKPEKTTLQRLVYTLQHRRTFRGDGAEVSRTLRHLCRSVLVPKCPGAEVSVKPIASLKFLVAPQSA